MDIEKLKETLKANGIDEETIAKVVADLEKKPDEEGGKPQEGEEELNGNESQGEGDPENGKPTPNPEDVPPQEVPSENNEGNANEEGELPPDGEVPPVPPQEGELPPENSQPNEPTTEEPTLPPVPPFDPTELIGKIDEMGKTIEGLLGRIASLEDALKGAGVLEKGDNENIGFENQGLPGTSSVSADDAMATVLAKLNKR